MSQLTKGKLSIQRENDLLTEKIEELEKQLSKTTDEKLACMEEFKIESEHFQDTITQLK